VEWPLYHRSHGAAELDAIRDALLRIDAPVAPSAEALA
jgi:hypothetical protein